MATCLSGWKELLSQETRFLFLSLTTALALQHAWPGSFPGPRWALGTPSSGPPPVLLPANRAQLSSQRPRVVQGINLLPCKIFAVVPEQAARSDLSLRPMPGLLAAYSVQSSSARMGTGTVPASALAGRALEPAANAAQPLKVLQGIKPELSLQSRCLLHQICIFEPRFVVMRVFCFTASLGASGTSLKGSRNLFCRLFFFYSKL